MAGQAYSDHTLQRTIELVNVLEYMFKGLDEASAMRVGCGKTLLLERTTAISPTKASRCWKKDDLVAD
jgi:hypothetical protein